MEELNMIELLLEDETFKDFSVDELESILEFIDEEN